jgi:hypothetical protein
MQTAKRTDDRAHIMCSLGTLCKEGIRVYRIDYI